MPDKWLFITPPDIELGISPDRKVLMMLRYPPEELNFAPGLHLGIALTPTEARRLAQTLQQKAGEAEDGLPRA